MVTRAKTDPNQEASPSSHQYFQVWFGLAERDFIQYNEKTWALLRLVWVAGHSALTQVVMGSPDLTTNGEVGGWVNLPATR